MKRRHGFTILELSVVLALMALMAGVVTVSVNGRLRGAQQDQVLASLKAIDQRARHHARSHPGEVTIELDAQESLIQVLVEIDGKRTIIDEYRVPTKSRWEIRDAWVLMGDRRVERKALSMGLNTQGIGPTYGFMLQNTESSVTNVSGEPGALPGVPNEPVAVLVAGVSGQFNVIEDEEHLQEILSTLSRHDAD